MQIRYDVGEKLDLPRMRKQLSRLIGTMPEITFEIYIIGFRVEINIVKCEESSLQDVRLKILNIKSLGGVIQSSVLITPSLDNRFSELKVIKELFPPGEYAANFQSSSKEEIIDKICPVIKTVHKINNLKVFL